MPYLRLLLVAGLVLLAGTGCGGDEPVRPSDRDGVASIAITNGSALTLAAIGDTVRLTATPRAANGSTVAGVQVTWTSSHPEIATISAAGLVTAVSNGTAVMTAASGSVTATASVSVQQAVTSVAVAPDAWSPTALQLTQQFTAVVRDANDNPIAGATVVWQVEGDSAITTTPDGLATAQRIGTASLRAVVGAHVGTAEIRVSQVLASVEVAPASWHPTALGTEQQFTAVARDANAQVIADAVVEWHAGDDSTISVTPAGLATAHRVGSTLLRAVIEDHEATAEIEVMQLLATVEVTPSSWEPTAIGTEQQLTVAGKDANGQPLTDWSVVWRSSDTAVVTVSADGLMRAVRQGSTVITGETPLGTTEVPVLVTQAVTAVTVSPGQDTLYAAGDTLQVVARATDANGVPIEGLAFTWASSAPAVVTVSPNGVVTAVAPGVAVITATTAAWSVQATITVLGTPPPTAVALQVIPGDWTATALGERMTFGVLAQDVHGAEVAVANLLWQSSNPAVATVDAQGEVTAISNGAATITARLGALTATASVIVDQSGAISNGVVWTVYFPRLVESPAIVAQGRLLTPKADFTAPWTDDGVSRFQWEAERIAMLSDVSGGQGTLRVRDRIGEWETLVVATAADFQLEGNLIGVRHGNGSVRVKSGVHGAWTVVANGGVAKFQLEGNRIGLLDTNGDFRVRDGLSGAWTTLVSGTARDFQLEGNRIGVLQDGGVFRVKDGINGAWTVLDAATAQSFQLEGNRIALLKTNGELRAKDGISGAWVVLASGGFQKYQLDGNRIGALRSNGTFYVKEGLSGAWTTLASSGATDFHLHQNRIGVVLNGNRVRIKTGGPSAPWGLDQTMSGTITQFHAAVAVPMPPYRTTPATYQALIAACQADCVRDAYIPFEWLTIPVPFYGRNCGHGRPAAGKSALSVDGMDQLCYHHDRQTSWYGHASGSIANDFGGACIVRYGLLNARLTRDGTVLTQGSAAYRQAWGLFPKTAEAVRRYLNWTLSCNTGYMNSFVQDTRLGL